MVVTRGTRAKIIDWQWPITHCGALHSTTSHITITYHTWFGSGLNFWALARSELVAHCRRGSGGPASTLLWAADPPESPFRTAVSVNPTRAILSSRGLITTTTLTITIHYHTYSNPPCSLPL